jgi:hypothetical protein
MKGKRQRRAGVGPLVAGADAHDAVDVGDPDLAVADLAGGGRLHDRVDHEVDATVVDDDLELDLRHEVDLVLGTSVGLGVPALTAEAAHLTHGHAGDAGGFERVLDLVELEGLDDGGDQLHAGEDAVADQRKVRLAGDQPDGQRGDEATGGSSEHGVDGDRRHELVGEQLRARVEAEPAHPQDEDAERGERDVVAGDRPRCAVLVVPADARPEEQRSHEGGDATGHVHDAGAGEVRVDRAVDRDVGDEAATPRPVHHDRIDEGAHHGREDQVGRELRALRHRSGGDRHRRGGEHRLEEERRRGAQSTFGDGCEIEVGQEEVARADEPTAALTECEGEAGREEGEDADDRICDVLGEDVDDVLRPGEAGLDECEACLHEEHQHAGDEHPDVVEVVLGSRDVVLGEADGWGDGQDGDDATQAGNDSKRSVAHGSSRGIGNRIAESSGAIASRIASAT